MQCSTSKRVLQRQCGPLLIAAIAIGSASPTVGQERTSPEARRARRSTPAVTVFREASPAVVNLSTTQIVTVRSPFGAGTIFDRVFDFPSRRPRQYKTQSVGSGFLIHGDGYLVTNAHVVDRAAECKVTFADGTEFMAQEVALDRESDLAVLKVDAPKALPYLKLGRSNDLMPGEEVIVIGNPLGYRHTITTGVISAVDRELRFNENQVYTGLIQTDASINPGNSGGPMLNVLGELIGINTAIRGDAQNIGFAIPVDRLHEMLPVMLDVQRLRRVDFGIHFDGRPPDDKPKGVRVKSVDPGTPAERAGITPGDILTAIDGQATPGFMNAFSVLQRTPVGRSLKLDLLQNNGRATSADVLIAAIPTRDVTRQMEKFFGLGLRELTGADRERLGLRRNIGLVITAVRRGTDAQRQDLSRSDIMTKFGGWPVTDLSGLAHLADQVESGDRIPFQILRIGEDSVVRFERVLKAL